MQLTTNLEQAISFRGEQDHIFAAQIDEFEIATIIDRGWVHGCPWCTMARIELFISTYGNRWINKKSQSTLVELLMDRYLREGLYCGIANIGESTPTINYPVPSCPVCRNVSRNLEAAQKLKRTNSSTYNLSDEEIEDVNERSVSPKAFSESVSELVGPLGIVMPPVIQNSPMLEAVNINSAQNLGSGLEVAGGKGWGFPQSHASCIGEALERYFLTGVYASHILASFDDIKDNAVNPFKEFGFPYKDNDFRTLTETSQIYWHKAENITPGINKAETTWVPSEIIFSPPPPAPGEKPYTIGSTNGVAAGANPREATAQGLLELIERSVYWYYMRNNIRGKEPYESDFTGKVIRSIHNNSDWDFKFSIYENRLDVPVVQCVAQHRNSDMCARGMGASLSTTRAIERAYLECIQMATSIATGVDVEPSEDHMRSLWYTGECTSVFSAAFDPLPAKEGCPSETRPPSLQDPASLLSKMAKCGMQIYRVVLADFSQFSVVKVIATGMTVDDPYHFTNGRYIAISNKKTLPSPSYSGTLFM